MTVTTPAPAGASPRGRRRGRETAGDMIRSMGLVLLIVVPVWYLAQPPKSDQKSIRVVDPTSDISAFRAAAPGVPAPDPSPAGWRATSSTLDPGALRIGYVVPGNSYAEYSASTGPSAPFLLDMTGDASQVGTVTVSSVGVGSTSWDELRDADAHLSLVRQVGGGTIVVGGIRETASLDRLRTLAAALR